MIHNLMPYLRHKHGDDVLLYFAEEAKEEALEDKWDEATNRVICSTETFLEEDMEDDIGLSDAKPYVDDQKKSLEEK